MWQRCWGGKHDEGLDRRRDMVGGAGAVGRWGVRVLGRQMWQGMWQGRRRRTSHYGAVLPMACTVVYC